MYSDICILKFKLTFSEAYNNPVIVAEMIRISAIRAVAFSCCIKACAAAFTGYFFIVKTPSSMAFTLLQTVSLNFSFLTLNEEFLFFTVVA